MPRRIWIGLIVLLCAVIGLHADDRLARVFDPPRLPDDIRLRQVLNLDAPFKFTPSFPDKNAWEKRAQELREQVLVANGLWPMPERTALNPVIHGKIDRDDYTIEKVFFASYPGHYVCGNLYRPKGRTGKLPAVLSPHGHWPNGRLIERSEAEAKKEIASGAERTMESARYHLQARCAMLARMGCVVFHYDMVGYADSRQIEHTKGFADPEAELRLQSFMGLQTWNSVRALDFLTSLPDVDPQRVAVTGASGGGTQTFLLGAIDDRPAVSFPAVMVSTGMQGGCICENCSLLRVGTNNIELAAMFAPKPQAMTGANDWTREIEHKGLPELKQVYRLYGAEDNVAAKYYPFGHNYNQVSREMMYGWLNRHLKLGYPEPVVEKPFVPVPPKELSVFDEQHPLPKDATNAEGLRKHLTATSDKQLAELAKKPEEYRRVVGTALRVIVNDQLPARSEPVASNYKALKGDGFAVHQSTLSRPGGGTQIPTIGIIPPGYTGDTVVVCVHPQGKAGLFVVDGKPIPLVQQLLDRKIAVLGADLFLTGEWHLPEKQTPAPWFDQKHHKAVPFAGYFFGYNRSLVANRVHDLLTLLAFAQTRGKTVHLIALGNAGPGALLGRALAGSAVQKAVIDLDGFDFDRVQSVTDEMMLPGASKYGGIYGFVPLCNTGETLLINAQKTGPWELAAKTPGVTLKHDGAAAEAMVQWLLK